MTAFAPQDGSPKSHGIILPLIGCFINNRSPPGCLQLIHKHSQVLNKLTAQVFKNSFSKWSQNISGVNTRISISHLYSWCSCFPPAFLNITNNSSPDYQERESMAFHCKNIHVIVLWPYSSTSSFQVYCLLVFGQLLKKNPSTLSF